MSDTPYQPVSCQLHSEIELLSMHAQNCQVFLHHQSLPVTGIIRDVVVKDKAEFLQLQSTTGELINIRLDHIDRIITD